ncbi:PEP-utilizing enzyme [Agromyces neolithicus]|uniref:PEP-utilizing enzyme n=1 Tax=Agromyces neolithicus TaxID=269420 RepID=UPI0031E331D1
MTEQILKVFPAVFAEFGILLERAEVAFVGGWVYNRTVPVGAPAPERGASAPPPRWLLWLLMRTHPAVRRRCRAAGRALALDLPAAVIRRWFDEWRPEHQSDVAKALGVDLRSLSDADLAAELDHRVEVIGHPAHIVVAIGYWIQVYELTELCRDLLGWDIPKTLSLLDGLSTASTRPGNQLADLARIARSSPAVLRLLADVDESTPGRLADADPEFARAFSEYVEANGHRSLRYDIIDPTLAEMPYLLLRLVAQQLELDVSPARAARESLHRRDRAADEALELLSSHSRDDKERFERALTRARRAFPALEDRVWWTTSVQAALLRYVALEIGRRLADRHQIDAVDDVFFLEADVSRSALLDGARCTEIVRIAKGQRDWAIRNPGPPAYGDPPRGAPPFDLLPRDARLVNQGVLWGITQVFGSPRGVRDERVVSGTPASGGRYTGPVRVITGDGDFDKIRTGDVVVCPTTSPAWSVVFPSMGALVADAGGMLSHPAIIAREYGIPAVVGAGNATALLHDGQTVTVDGTTGVVELG